ncbi:MAG: molybdenum cofactor biosynthesis protein [Rickettsiales bacterium]|nr:molybdenum cofactor biosynthesis protein [Rickettsiales bacterium]
MNSSNTRYSRQIKLPEVGQEGQDKLAQAKVLLVGVGGLGCPAAQYLVAAGIGTIGLMDHDKVDETNLHRQILFGLEDVGSYKAEAAKKALHRINDQVDIKTYNFGLSVDNSTDLFKTYDVIVDGTDNFQTKYLINDAALKTNKPWVYASIFKFEGQLSVFNYQNGPSYRCLFPKAPQEDMSCEETGVLGILPGIFGVYQATEVIKIILGIGEVLSGKLKIIHTLTMQERIISFKRVEERIAAITNKALALESINCSLINESKTYLDVREPHEQPQPDNKNIIKIPLTELASRYEEIPNSTDIHVYCQSGIRSVKAINFLREQGYNNLINVEGGIQSILK